MRRLSLKTGGRPRSLDDLQVLQDLADKSGSAILKGRGAFIISGCQVSGTTIAPGFVYIDGAIIEFAGVSVSSFPAYLKTAPLTEETPQAYEDGNIKPTQSLSTAVVVYDVPVGVESVPFTVSGGRTYFDAISDSAVLTRGNQVIGGLKNFTEKIVSAGFSLVDEIAAIKALGWVNSGRIADAAVTGAKLADGSVSASKIENNAVATSKIADSAITTNKVAALAITESRLGSGAVTTDKIGNAQVTAAKLSSDVNIMFGGNQAQSSTWVDWRDSTNARERTYSYVSYSFQKVKGLRPYVKLAFYAMRDSGNRDILECILQRSSSSSFSSTVEVARRIFRLDDNSWQYCPIDVVDTVSTAGTYYYRMVCRNIEGNGNLNNFSNAFESVIFSVPYSL